MATTGTAGTESIATLLAERICAFQDADLTPLARQRTRVAIIDTFAVILGGIKEECVARLRAVPGIAGAAGPALVFGTADRTSVLDAALINGTAAHALDYDDFSGVFGGHQSAPLLSGLIALGEDRKLSGADVMLAYVVGVEVETRFARAVHFHHYDKGWHPTATLGVIGAAAAAAKLIGLTSAQTATALAIAASSAAGLKANFGTMTKPLHVGQCARAGVFAALLAEQGFTSNPAAFEHDQGFFNVYNGPGQFTVESLVANWNEPLEIEGDTVAIKRFPCCGSTHPAIELGLALHRELRPTVEDIRKILIMPHPRRLKHTNNPAPKSSLEAKFSVQYLFARALIDGAVRLDHFDNDAYGTPEVRRILELTTATAHPDMDDTTPGQWSCEVVVELTDGQRFTRNSDLFGDEQRAAIPSPDVLWEKFEDCAARSLPRDRLAPLFERLETFDSARDLALVTKLMEVAPKAREISQTGARQVAAATAACNPETDWVP